jgi:hypothetical protein
MCHLLVTPHQHDDIIMKSCRHHPIIMMMSPFVPTDINVEFDPIDFLPIWEFDQNAITFTYGVCLRKKLYGQNQCDETDAMTLASSDYEKFDF